MNGWTPILCYHRIAETPPEGDPNRLCTPPARFERTLRYLIERGYRFVSLERAVTNLDQPRPERVICLTFDDGYRDFFDCAFPVLQRFGLPAAVFAVAGRLGEASVWDDGPRSRPAPLMTSEQLRFLISRGIEVGSHTLTHQRLTGLDTAALQAEVAASKATLEELLQQPIRHFCYPYAAVDQAAIAAAEDAGYTSAAGGEQPAHERFLLHRIDAARSWPSLLYRLSGWRYRLQHTPLRTLKRMVVR